MTATAREMKELFLTERHAERSALPFARGESAVHSARLNYCEPDCDVQNEKGETVTLHIQNIYDKRAWKKFIDQEKIESYELEWLTNNAGKLAIRYAHWLQSGGYTKRYTFIKTRAQIRWLRSATRVVVLRRMMEHKHEVHCFIDEWAEAEMGKTLALNICFENMFRAVQHSMDDKELAHKFIDDAYNMSLALIEKLRFVPFDALPPLPHNIDPLALPDVDEDEEDEIDE